MESGEKSGRVEQSVGEIRIVSGGGRTGRGGPDLGFGVRKESRVSIL